MRAADTRSDGSQESPAGHGQRRADAVRARIRCARRAIVRPNQFRLARACTGSMPSVSLAWTAITARPAVSSSCRWRSALLAAFVVLGTPDTVTIRLGSGRSTALHELGAVSGR